MYDNPHPMDNLVIQDLLQRFKRPVQRRNIKVTYVPTETKFYKFVWDGELHMRPKPQWDIIWEIDYENAPF